MTLYKVDLSRAKRFSRRKRAKKAMAILREKLEEREGEEVSISPEINEELWKQGVENPPSRLTVEVKEVDGRKTALPGSITDEKQDSGREEKEEETEESPETGEEEDYEGILSGTVSDAKDAIRDMDEPDLERLLEMEEQGKDRKTLKEFIENRM